MENKDAQVQAESLTNEVHGLMVTRLYCDRIRDALTICVASTGTDDDSASEKIWSSWTTRTVTESCLPLENEERPIPPTKRQKSDGAQHGNGNVDQQESFIIPTPFEKGGRKQRTGYNLLMMKNVRISPAELSPIARQNISWVKVLTHRVFVESPIGGETETEQATRTRNGEKDTTFLLDSLAQELYSQFDKKIKDNSLLLRDVPIRVDVFPKTIAETLCRSLQLHAENIEKSNTVIEGDAFSGPLYLTKSQSKATFVISIIQVDDKEYMFGIATKDDHCKLNSKMNDKAASQVVVQAADKMGKDVGVRVVPCGNPFVPLSRAYYKLKQVFENQADFIEKCVTTGGSGVDLGSSPGGWVQNLHQIGISKILSIDPGILAERAEELDGVKHLRKDFTSVESVQEMASFAPFSICVCDASTDASEVFAKVGSTLVNVNDRLKEHGCGRRLFTVPSTLVITIKCPFKTVGSLGRMLEKVSNQLPAVIQSLLKCMNSDRSEEVVAKYDMVHLMANSESERTVLIRLETSSSNLS